MVQERHRPHQFLRKALSITQPGVGHKALSQCPAVLARHLGVSLPVAVHGAQLGCVLFMNRSIHSARLRLDPDARGPHHVINEYSQSTTTQVVIAFRYRAWARRATRSSAHKCIGAAVVAAPPAGGAGLGTFIVGECFAGLGTFQALDRIAPGDQTIDDVHDGVG